MTFPSLRTRSEHSFRRSFAPINRLKDYCTRNEVPFAGLVDDGTWGHVKWEKAFQGTGTTAGYGLEVPIIQEEKARTHPTAWVLFTDLAAGYRWSSRTPTDAEAMASFRGCGIRFSGSTLHDPELFDYIDINPFSRRATMQAVELSATVNRPLVITSDNRYAALEDRACFLSICSDSQITPQHILLREEVEQWFSWLPAELLTAAIGNTYEVAQELAAKQLQLAKAPMIHFDGDLVQTVELGKEYRLQHGHIVQWSAEYEERLQKEIRLIQEKNYESYFLMVADLVTWAKDRMLVGPARGSSAGSLVCYLLRITEVDPLVHRLLFERFIDLNRNDLPDIDIDFNDDRRPMVLDYLREKYGEQNVAKIGNVSRLKPRSAIAEVGKRVGIPVEATFAVRNAIIEYSSGDARFGKGLEDTFENTEPGQRLVHAFPECFPMKEVEEHAWHTSVHAAGVIISNTPVTHFCTVRDGIAQVDKKDAEYLNLLKVDLLGLRTLGIIEGAGVVNQDELYSLDLKDQKVYQILNEHRWSGIFQFNGAAQRNISGKIQIDEFKTIDHLTALARPGPLGAGVVDDYFKRINGLAPITYRHEMLQEYLADTFGLVLYQEQVMNIVRNMGQFSWEETSTIRKAMSASLGEEFFGQLKIRFLEGAAEQSIPKQIAETIWHEICTFGAWGMNRSHTVSYGIISYWCGYLKAYHPLEFAASFLRSTDDEMTCIEMLREITDQGFEYRAFDVERSLKDWSVQDGMLIGGFQNIRGVGAWRAGQMVNRRNADRLTEKDMELIDGEIQYQILNPVHEQWGHLYEKPHEHRIRGPIKEFSELEDQEHCCVIAKVIKRIRADQNETRRIERRGGKVYRGQSKFVDLMCIDDSVAKPIRVRIQPRDWFAFGEKYADRLVDNEDFVLVRGRYLDHFEMLTVDKIRCLTNPEILR